MYIAICDDEKEHIIQLENYMQKLREKFRNLRWTTFDSAESFLLEYNKNPSDFNILITDIEMKKMNGVELADKIRKNNRNIIIFFLTSHKEYAIQCFRPEPMNFWVKPIKYSILEQDFKRAAERIRQSAKHITIMEERFPVKINIVDIKYIEKVDRKTVIHTVNGTHTTNKLLSHIQSELPEDMFVKVYISYIVNLSYVQKISDKSLFFVGEKEPLSVSRTYAGELRKRFIAYKERRALRNGNSNYR